MKRLFSLILSTILVLTLVGCSEVGKPSETTGEKNKTNPQQQDVSQGSQDGDNTEPVTTGIGTIDVPMRDIYVDYPNTYKYAETGCTSMIYDDKDSMVAFVYDGETPFEGTLDDVLPFLDNIFLDDADTYSKGTLRGSKLENISTQNDKIAGFDCIKFTATAENFEGWDCYVCGYTFYINDLPCAIFGLVAKQNQDATLIANTTALAERIASTIRIEK